MDEGTQSPYSEFRSFYFLNKITYSVEEVDGETGKIGAKKN